MKRVLLVARNPVINITNRMSVNLINITTMINYRYYASIVATVNVAMCLCFTQLISLAFPPMEGVDGQRGDVHEDLLFDCTHHMYTVFMNRSDCSMYKLLSQCVSICLPIKQNGIGVGRERREKDKFRLPYTLHRRT